MMPKYVLLKGLAQEASERQGGRRFTLSSGEIPGRRPERLPVHTRRFTGTEQTGDSRGLPERASQEHPTSSPATSPSSCHRARTIKSRSARGPTGPPEQTDRRLPIGDPPRSLPGPRPRKKIRRSSGYTTPADPQHRPVSDTAFACTTPPADETSNASPLSSNESITTPPHQATHYLPTFRTVLHLRDQIPRRLTRGPVPFPPRRARLDHRRHPLQETQPAWNGGPPHEMASSCPR